MRSTDLRTIITSNAAEIRRLCKSIRDTLDPLDHGQEAMEARQRAAHAFHARYDDLAFPGGLRSGLRKLEAGDVRAIEAAILYLELRPFHIRAQYNREAFTKILKRQKLPPKLQSRFDATRERLRAWREAARARA